MDNDVIALAKAIRHHESNGKFDAKGALDAEAEAVHRAFVARNLSPGGSADLLAMTLFVDGLEAA